MTIVAERLFYPADQALFAALSGDYNPMHMDEVAARRTLFGAPVVHGVHLLCWALDSWLAPRDGSAASLERLAASFSRGVLVGETVRASSSSTGDEFALRIHQDRSEMASIRGSLSSPVEYRNPLPPLDGARECRVLDRAALSQAAGKLPLCHADAEARRLFPQLSKILPPFQFAAILATTRLVGMECPGLHSLYSAMDLSFAREAAGAPELSYRVSHVNPFGGIVLAVEGPGFQGELRAFLRPAPRAQAAVAELARSVEKDEFSDQRALVIGGSRGLGEVAAKLLAIGGAEVTITYNRGKQEAEAIAIEIAAFGRKCAVIHFDSRNPSIPSALELPTHLYYLATPQITSDRAAGFSGERYAEYSRFYVTDFARTLLELAQADRPIQVFYPSTVLLDENSSNLAEYCTAKAAGEELCKQMERRFPSWRIYAPRLPRMSTDQNNGLLPAKLEAPEAVMLRHLRHMKNGN